MEEKSLAGDFTQESIAKKLIKFMIPILGALVLQAMYGAVDLLVVGQFGTLYLQYGVHCEICGIFKGIQF